MDRPRRKRRAPERTGPIRNAGEAWRGDEPRRDDAASSGVRAGYRVIEEQIRRGRRMAQTLDEEEWNGDPSPGARRPRSPYAGRGGRRESTGGFRLLETQMRHIGLLVREILRQMSSERPEPFRLAELVFRLYVESLSELARFGFDALGALAGRREDSFAADVDEIDRDIDETWEEIEDDEEEPEARDWPAAPGAPTVIRAKVPIPVYVASDEKTEIDLDVPAGSQPLTLEVETPAASAAGEPAPAFEADFVALPDGPVILRIEVPRDLPAGRYLRRILIRATGEPVGSLKVQVGTLPAKAKKR
jgi:hypothetical protein